MFNLFFFLFLGGVYSPLDVGEIPTFDTFAKCAEVGQAVVDIVAAAPGKIIWICEEIDE